MIVANKSININQIFPWPVAIVISSPGCVIIILHNGILNAKLLNRLLHVLSLFLKLKFRRMNPDNQKSLVTVLCIPRRKIRQCSLAVDAGIGPEIKENNFFANVISESEIFRVK